MVLSTYFFRVGGYFEMFTSPQFEDIELYERLAAVTNLTVLPRDVSQIEVIRQEICA